MTGPGRVPVPGDIVRLARAASVQFTGEQAIILRVIGIDKRPTYHGWIWLIGYQLDHQGDALTKRRVFVQIRGIEFPRLK